MATTEEQSGTTGTALAHTPAARPPTQMGVAPREVDEAWRLATMVSQSTIVPKDFQGKPANVLIAIEAGMEVGIPWMQAVQGSAIINGRHGFYGDLFLAIIVSSAVFEDHDEYFLVAGDRREVLTADDLKLDATTAVCAFTRKGRARPIVRTFSVAQAKKAGLLSKDGPWQTYPDRQLRMRARSLAGRDAFPDVLKGMRLAEELRDIPPEPGPPIEVAPIEPRRASASARTEPDGFPPIATHDEVKDIYAEGLSTGIDLGRKLAAESSERGHTPETVEPGLITPATPPESPAPRSTAPPCEVRPMRIAHTAYITPKGEQPYYEITAESPLGKRLVFITREQTLYTEAASFEGTKFPVVITYSLRQTANKKSVVSLLESIAFDDTTPPVPFPPKGDPDHPLFNE